jgi:redox-regulated HSP33 family molecular chaperone
VGLRCACSRVRMLFHLRRLTEADRNDLFAPGSSELEITSEYCKTVYRITKEEVEAEEDLVN